MGTLSQEDSETNEFDDVDEGDFLLAESGDHVVLKTGSKRKSSSHYDGNSNAKKPKGDSDSVSVAKAILKGTWGFPNFRLKQEKVISRLISGGSAVVVFPTGGGKSLVYQIPALALNEYDEICGRTPGNGITLVVSPLIALMKVSHKGTYPCNVLGQHTT